MNKLTKIYHSDIDFIKPFLKSDSLVRLKGIGMNCGVEYTSFPFFKQLNKYSRYTHSINVAKIIYHFNSSIKESLSGLFHDISSGTFSHVIDFVYNDYLNQEYTEKDTSSIISSDKVIMNNLNKLNIKVSEVDNYHLYPIADNSTPKLSADRLEYTLSNFYNFNFLSINEIKDIYNDLKVNKNEFNEDEICFSSLEKAKLFTINMIKNSKIYVGDEDRYSMEILSKILLLALNKNIITESDFYTTEKDIIKKLYLDLEIKEKFINFTKLNKVVISDKQIDDSYIKIFAKKRYIDPFVIPYKKRISQIDKDIKKLIDDFVNSSQNYYIKGIYN